jgi:UDP-N-acetylglucosamine--N-acetylmuramyl-(pentapeptide) pyrophosphoryl-undecaprenol N-acetylglucosamine transferase
LRVLIAAGGTAGHLAPALAVARQLELDGCHVEFATGSRDVDRETVEHAGFTAHSFEISGLPRRPSIAAARALGRAVTAVKACREIVRATRADVVLAGGGYVSVPVALAARSMRIPVVATEADAHLGLANRTTGRFARRICTAYPVGEFRRKQTVTGRPVDTAFFECERTAARASLEIGDDERLLVVVGGSGGALRINKAVYDAYSINDDPRVGDVPLSIVHVTGRRDFAQFASPAPASERYRIVEYSDDMPTLFAAADLVLMRAGGSVFEAAAAGRAVVLVPYPHATGDHQRANARHVEAAGGAVVLDDARCTAQHVHSLVAELLAPDGDVRRAAMEASMRAFARPHAAASIAKIVTSVGAAGRRQRGAR